MNDGFDEEIVEEESGSIGGGMGINIPSAPLKVDIKIKTVPEKILVCDKIIKIYIKQHRIKYNII